VTDRQRVGLLFTSETPIGMREVKLSVTTYCLNYFSRYFRCSRGRA
jgi:hypothetical protein